MSEWIDIKEAEKGSYIYASNEVQYVQLIYIIDRGYVSGVDMYGAEWNANLRELDGYVKSSKAVDICPFLGGES